MWKQGRGLLSKILLYEAGLSLLRKTAKFS